MSVKIVPIVLTPSPPLPISVLTGTLVPSRSAAPLPSPQAPAIAANPAAAPATPQPPIVAAGPVAQPAGAEAAAPPPPEAKPQATGTPPSVTAVATAHPAQPRPVVAGQPPVKPISPTPQGPPPVPVASVTTPEAPPIAVAVPTVDAPPTVNVASAARMVAEATPARPQPAPLLPLSESSAGQEPSASALSPQRSRLRSAPAQAASPASSGEVATTTIGSVLPRRPQPHPSLAILQAIAAAVRRNVAEPGIADESESVEHPGTAPKTPFPTTPAPTFDEAAAVGEPRFCREWVVTWLPLILPESALPTRWLHRHTDEGGSGEQRGGSDRRFVAEAAFESFGRVQVDGLVRPASRTVSVIVRSERALGDEHRAMIVRIFQEGVELAGYGGDISYAPPPAVFVEPAATSDAVSRIGLTV